MTPTTAYALTRANLNTAARHFVNFLGEFKSLELTLAVYRLGAERIREQNDIPHDSDVRQLVVDISAAMGLEIDLLKQSACSSSTNQSNNQSSNPSSQGVQSIVKVKYWKATSLNNYRLMPVGFLMCLSMY